MAYSRSVYEKADSILASRKAAAEAEAEKRKEIFGKQHPEYYEYRRAMVQAALDVVKSLSMKDKTKVAEFMEQQKKKSLDAQDAIRALLVSSGLPADHLDTHYSCPVCSDTGVINNRYCECRNKLVRNLAYEELSESSSLKISSFEDFDLGYYSDTAKVGKKSQREHMKAILDYCRQYADNFDLTCGSIFMTGDTGLGKTHLSLAIAGKAIDKGYGVIYGSCQNLMNKLENEHFGRSENENTMDMLTHCDLLILDDVGAEFVTQFSASQIYNIVNTRMILGLPTILNTNLSLDEFNKKYFGRVASRVIGTYAVLAFYGSDIRQMKKNGKHA
ncbi:MAG: ATP-binding protein [Clostridia bacterium]|nr:ATP-binding protein [Clostridia bacterium]